MTMVLDSKQPLSCSAQLEGGTTMYMPPELLVPSKFGLEDSVPTQKSDIYVFGVVIHHVRNRSRGYMLYAYIIQVLTGEVPFRGLRWEEIIVSVVEGKRPVKPKNAPDLGLSDLLWDLVQRCWNGKLELRPTITEVVSQLGRAATAWGGVMPPHALVENIVSEIPEPASDPIEHCKLCILIAP